MRLSAWGLRAQAFAGLMIINFAMRVFNPRTGACSFVLGYCLIPRYILSGCGHHLSHSGSVVARVRESGMPNGVSPGPWHFNGAVLLVDPNEFHLWHGCRSATSGTGPRTVCRREPPQSLAGGGCGGFDSRYTPVVGLGRVG